MKLVVYSNDNVRDSGGSFAVLVPTGELSFEATLAKDIPAGSEYKIAKIKDIIILIEAKDIPNNLNSTTLHDGANLLCNSFKSISLDIFLLISVLQLDSSSITPYSIPTWYPARKKPTIDVKVIKIINEYFQLFFKKNKAESNKIK